MHLISWFFINHPVLRLILSSVFPIMLLSFPWLSPIVEKWVGFLATGFVQSIFVGLLGAGLVLLVSIPFYFLFSTSDKKLNSRQQLLSDNVFVSKILWPHKIVSFALLLGSFFYFQGLSEIESIIVFFLTFLQFIYYFKRRDNISQGLDFLFYVESGIILVVSAGLGLIISIFFLLFMTEPSEVPSWNPMDDRGLRFLAIFCAATQSFYQIYLTRKLKRAASILNA